MTFVASKLLNGLTLYPAFIYANVRSVISGFYPALICVNVRSVISGVYPALICVNVRSVISGVYPALICVNVRAVISGVDFITIRGMYEWYVAAVMCTSTVSRRLILALVVEAFRPGSASFVVSHDGDTRCELDNALPLSKCSEDSND